MEKTRPILYGVADYAQIRKKNAWFVDRTARIRDLEQTAYAVFLRPRCLGEAALPLGQRASRPWRSTGSPLCSTEASAC